MAALWAGRGGRSFVQFTGSFDSAGHAAVPQQAEGAGQGAAVYAYDEAAKNYLYVPGQDPQAYVFTPSLFLVDELPAW